MYGTERRFDRLKENSKFRPHVVTHVVSCLSRDRQSSPLLSLSLSLSLALTRPNMLTTFHTNTKQLDQRLTTQGSGAHDEAVVGMGS
ncbi:hypothetical protein E2C01_012672 [Portunus trituberculatus]|uniref:Uncharacterized protein n=1 Tax=Portunus trituberculatus TaxID=210409 RepID=A0A5B7DEV4_PORTR|nr:hypothetical protein [Portunus trituberculatus]